MNFKKINSITGWAVFAIASVVYLFTIEPTTSFWDCGEFISSAYKLEVGHPPGAPFFMLVARIFTLFAGNDVKLVAKMVNIFSALCSSFTILLLFWTITHLGRKLVGRLIAEFTPVQTISIIGSGVVGALAYTFSDTFWFSAVEGEVYAFSSLFTALVFWAVLKWEDEADRRYAARWLILIAYLMGLSIGVHLLNLLAIPAIGLVYYHRKYPVTLKGTLTALLISAGILLVILYGIIPGIVQLAVWFELRFVKDMGLPMNTGIIIYAGLLIGGIVFGLVYSLRMKKVMLNNVLLFAAVIIIGYCSYAATVIRSAAELPMDQNNPQNIFNLQAYLNREQYGDRPLFTGPYYNSPIVDIKNKGMQYVKFEDKYVEVGEKFEYVYKDGSTTIFPRMFSRDQSGHISAYKEWAGIPASQSSNKTPTFGQNLKFFFSYQLGFMYFRYFLWNFAGRQNDIQGHGNVLHGNWISGITPLDEARLGPQDLPETMQNKGRNAYYFLPLILGIIGMVYQFQRNRPDFWVIMLLFFMTGIAIVVYLNQTPYQPRERDYAYAGSFYAFAVWIGLGVMAAIEAIPDKFRSKYIAVVISLALLMLVPGIMATENWDDHDRSGRYTTRDFAHNYLESCDENALIFTNGDNDTFPLWYAQEVEGIRTDIRVVNLSYLAADWYIEQMARKAYGSDVLPFSLTPLQYLKGTRDHLYIHDEVDGKYYDLKTVMKFIANDNISTKGIMTADGFMTARKIGSRANGMNLSDYVPARNLKIPVDKDKVLSNGTVALKDSALIVPEVRWTLNDERGDPLESIFKNSMMVLDVLANNDWERPVYFAITVPRDSYLNLSEYFQLDGLANRIVPVKASESGGIDTDKLYDKLMNVFLWGNIEDPKVYLDETNVRLLTHFRSNFGRLAGALIDEGKKDSAIMVLDRAFETIPTFQLPLNYADIPLLENYYIAGAIDKGNALANEIFLAVKDELEYLLSFPRVYINSFGYELQVRQSTLWNLCNIALTSRQSDLFETFRTQWDTMFPEQKWNMMFPSEIMENEILPDE
jgi:hypothetical protein